MTSPQISIFLDFDGVMHAATNDVVLFRHEEYLCRVLGDYPTVQLVISSAWRRTHTLDTMKSFFLTDLRAKVVGMTPVFKQRGVDKSAAPGARYREILQYLAASGDPGQRWIALDDDAALFPPCANLVLCDPRYGFNAAAEKALRAALTALLCTEKSIQMGDALGALGHELGLTAEDAELIDQAADKTPAQPPRLD